MDEQELAVIEGHAPHDWDDGVQYPCTYCHETMRRLVAEVRRLRAALAAARREHPCPRCGTPTQQPSLCLFCD
jgi:hypothetical protein